MLSIEYLGAEFAVCIDDNGDKIKIPRSALPDSAAVNDIITESFGGSYGIDSVETKSRKSRNRTLLERIDASSRRDSIADILAASKIPISASALAEKFGVSRQIIVGDIALLRASGAPVVATPRGYLIEQSVAAVSSDDYTIACCHGQDGTLLEELYTIVDNGATVVDVIVEHPVYGQLTGLLQVSSRYDADRFVEMLVEGKAAPLSQITDGIHLHTIRCADPERVEYIKKQLSKKGILISE